MNPIDAIQGAPNACAPLPGLVTGGQPNPAQLAQVKQANVDLVLDIRDPAEPRGFDEPATLRELGVPYINIPVNAATMTPATLGKILTVLREHKDRSVFFHCGSGARVGAALVPYLIQDHGFTQEDAVQTAIHVGLKSPEMLQWSFAYLEAHDA